MADDLEDDRWLYGDSSDDKPADTSEEVQQESPEKSNAPEEQDELEEPISQPTPTVSYM